MTIAELIDVLETHDPNAVVVLADHYRVERKCLSACALPGLAYRRAGGQLPDRGKRLVSTADVKNP